MSIIDKMDRYLTDKIFKITYFNNSININNYIEIIDFNDNKIKIKYDQGICIIEGKNLTLNKMIDNEILIEGNINNISLS